MLTKEKINYLEIMQKELISSLKESLKELEKNEYLFHSSNRAKFKRLRVEITKKMVDIEKEIY